MSSQDGLITFQLPCELAPPRVISTEPGEEVVLHLSGGCQAAVLRETAALTQQSFELTWGRGGHSSWLQKVKGMGGKQT